MSCGWHHIQSEMKYMWCLLKHLNASSLISPAQKHLPPLHHSCVSSFLQNTQPEQDSPGCSGHLQRLLYAAVAVRPVCAAHSGKGVWCEGCTESAKLQMSSFCHAFTQYSWDIHFKDNRKWRFYLLGNEALGFCAIFLTHDKFSTNVWHLKATN